MVERLLELIINILSKQLIPTLVSIVGVAIITYTLPEEASIRVKLGDSFFYIALFALIFIIIKLIVYLYELISRRITYRKNIIIRNEQVEKDNEKNFDKIMAEVDGYQQKEREILEHFINSNNDPIPLSKVIQAHNDYINSTFDSYPLHSSKWLIGTNIQKDGKSTDYVKLNTDIFNILSACQKSRGSISNFSMQKCSNEEDN